MIREQLLRQMGYHMEVPEGEKGLVARTPRKRVIVANVYLVNKDGEKKFLAREQTVIIFEPPLFDPESSFADDREFLKSAQIKW